MGEKGLKSLEALVEKSICKNLISLVVGSHDESVENDYYLEIKKLSVNSGIPFLNRKDITETPAVKYGVAISWRWLIDTRKLELIVLHDSLLPQYRGFNPLVTALLNGDGQIGVTAIVANEEADAGPIVGQIKIPISYPLKIKTAIELISTSYQQLVCTVFEKIEKGSIETTPQDEGLASYSMWRDEEDYHIQWEKSSIEIKRQIDATGFPYKGASAIIDDVKIRILDAEIVADKKIANRDVGKIFSIDHGVPIVICGVGLLKITTAIDCNTGQKFEFKKLRSRLK